MRIESNSMNRPLTSYSLLLPDGDMEDLHTINIAVLLPMTGQRAMGRTIAGAVTLGMEYLEQAPELEPVRSVTCSIVSFQCKYKVH